MRAGALGWRHVQGEEERQRLKRALLTSLGIHVGLVLVLVITPPSFDSDIPEAITVELIAGPQMAPPAAPKAAARRRSPPPKAEPAPPKPEPAAEPAPPPPPKAKAPVQVLPENESRPDKKVKQASEAKPKPAPKKPAPEKAQSYDDAMKALDEEFGDEELDELLEATPQRPSAQVAARSGGAERSQRGVRLSPAMMDWMEKSVRLIQSKWVTPSNFRGRGLVTYLELDLSSSGKLQGEPTVVRSSGDPYFDDTAVAALISVGSLPPPPRAGRLDFYFSSDEE